jgi:hypothetical protein
LYTARTPDLLLQKWTDQGDKLENDAALEPHNWVVATQDRAIAERKLEGSATQIKRTKSSAPSPQVEVEGAGSIGPLSSSNTTISEVPDDVIEELLGQGLSYLEWKG